MRHLAKAERVNMFKIPTHKNGFGVEDCESKPEILVGCLLCHWQDLPAGLGTAQVLVCGVSADASTGSGHRLKSSPDQISGLGVLPVPRATCTLPDLWPLTL